MQEWLPTRANWALVKPWTESMRNSNAPISPAYIECLDRGVDLANKLGNTEKAAAWSAAAAVARKGFERRWWNSSLRCYAQSCAGQTMQAIPLALNITSAAHRATNLLTH